MRWVFLTAVFTACLLAGPLNAAEEKVLNFYNWADYIHPDTIRNFEEEYGIRVNYDLFDTSAVVEAKLLAGSTGYDLVLQALRFSTRLMPVGVFQPIDHAQLTLWENLDPWVLNIMARYDPDNTFAVPYMWGTTGFMYNVEMILERLPDAPVGSAAMLFDPEVVAHFADCGVTWLDEASTVIPLVMLYLGYDPHSIVPEQLEEAEAVLKSVRPYIYYISSGMGINDMGNKEVCLAMTWSGDYTQAQNRADEVGVDITLAYTVPSEGTVMWFDSLLIPSDAPHPENAHLFLNYLLRPEVMAPISEHTGYGNANLASWPLIDPELANDPAAYPPMEARQGWQAGLLYDPKRERQRSRLWSRVKTGL
ncbi:MAG TPA: polyamine ABC transporter substrate-binding protein [Xanthomonadales bacterium]|nr:polyamine ABC transporter substrate-binding protein [Xanthomonadales bacterium]